MGTSQTLPIDIKFSPNETLAFALTDASPAQASLIVTNNSAKAVAFKVKTTTPERYLVKPNHGLLLGGESVDVSIIIVRAKKKDIIAQRKSSGAFKCSDKFLIQSVILDAVDVKKFFEGKAPAERTDALNTVLTCTDKKELHAKKLVVTFAFPDLDGVPTYCDYTHEESGMGRLESTSPAPIPGTPEAMFAEIVALRKKYDDLVAFTVNLTAERDLLSADLAALKETMASFEARKRTKPDSRIKLEVEDRSPNSTAEVAVRGFTWVHVTFVACSALALGLLCQVFNVP
mmetsp:Transcript_6975/g.29097  ORF Transcript_6975/g.29097 Transcript_6975/m.29097 type:complete len:288 (-) Transcript_6975:747-1610(-)